MQGECGDISGGKTCGLKDTAKLFCFDAGE